ncbi:MAG: tRNA dihydrouridine(20/20a) synthase DusA [Ahrensia sp.]|nr:tRNA dihydrouridine(20/20a) synthase DusA [Ahrensia sp.]
MYLKQLDNKAKILAVAPMMDWTDRHCRYFHRHLSHDALLYTEMVVADALIHGDPARHLDFDATEHPIALQLGGNEPEKLARAVKIAAPWSYDEINLNVGCPSDRVQSGTFGACLMREPILVADIVKAMKDVSEVPVTVKCRLGVDDQDAQAALDDVAGVCFEAGVDGLWVHARKAWLQGLSPKQNREVPPLDYDRVSRLKRDWPDRFIGLNGGLTTVEAAQEALLWADGVMIGRAAYQTPRFLAQLQRSMFPRLAEPLDDAQLRDVMMEYSRRHLADDGRLHHVTRHMIGLFAGEPGARQFRRILSVDASSAQADETVIADAFDAIQSLAA